MIVWLDGRLIDGAEARIDPADRGFTLGDGLFETVLVRHGSVRRLDAHLERLRRGCDVLQLPCPSLDLGEAMAATLAANRLADGVVRLTLTRGAGPRGIMPPVPSHPTLLITAGPLPPPRPPLACILAETTRRNQHSPLSRIKSLNYLDNILARQEAVRRGADEALLLNTAGLLAESTIANLFVVKRGAVLTPPVADGALPGVMRAAVLAAARGRDRSLTPDDLDGADEIFLSSSLGLQAVRAVAGKTPEFDPARPVMTALAAELA